MAEQFHEHPFLFGRAASRKRRAWADQHTLDDRVVSDGNDGVTGAIREIGPSAAAHPADAAAHVCHVSFEPGWGPR